MSILAEQLADALVKHNDLEYRKRATESNVAYYKRSVESYLANIKAYTKSLEQEKLRLEKEEKLLEKLKAEKPPKGNTKKVEAQLDFLARDPRIEFLTFESLGRTPTPYLHIVTVPYWFFRKTNGNRHECGPLEIFVNLAPDYAFDTEICRYTAGGFFNQEPWNNFPMQVHPHVIAETKAHPCYGDVEVPYREAWAKQEMDTAILILLEFLHSCKDTAAQYKYWYFPRLIDGKLELQPKDDKRKVCKEAKHKFCTRCEQCKTCGDCHACGECGAHDGCCCEHDRCPDCEACLDCDGCTCENDDE